MSNESRSRVTNKKAYEENYDDIFRNGKRMQHTMIKEEKSVNNEVWGKATRYHLKKDTIQKFGEAPSIGKPKATAETSLENYRGE